ncbi:ComEA family DNA-binding protein [Leucobacter sp. GX0328]
MSAKARTRDGMVPGYGWLLGMSSWILCTAVPNSATAWLGFLIIGIVARRFSWGVLGVAAGALAILAHLPIWGQFGPVAVLVVYLAGMLAALWVNPAWLRLMWGRRASRAANSSASAPSSSRTATTDAAASRQRQNRAAKRRTAAAQTAKRKREDAEAERPRSRTTAAAPAAAPPKVAAESEPQRLAERAGASTEGMLAGNPRTDAGEPIDVNEATAAQFAKLPGLTRSRAQRAVRLRRDGRYTSLEDFAARLELQPHELVRLRPGLSCAPPPRGPRSFGRRVDY